MVRKVLLYVGLFLLILLINIGAYISIMIFTGNIVLYGIFTSILYLIYFAIKFKIFKKLVNFRFYSTVDKWINENKEYVNKL